MATKFLPYTKQKITKEDIAAVGKALKGEWITRGPLVQEFEEKVASWCGACYAVAFNSGTSALEASYYAAELSSEDRLFTAPNTFIGTVAGALKRGAQLKLVDIAFATGSIDLEKLRVAINHPATRGRDVIVPIHFAGATVDMAQLDLLIRTPKTVVIEDAAHAFGSRYVTGELVGSCHYSDITVFSFHPAKQIATGEGGLCTTNSEELYRRLQQFRNNGLNEAGISEEFSGNHHMTEFQAALGLSQFARVEEMREKRAELMKFYRSELSDWMLFDAEIDERSCYHLCALLIDEEKSKVPKRELQAKLTAKEIGTQVHYKPLYHHPAVSKRDLSPYFPEMERFFAQELSIPFHLDVDEKAAKHVCETIKKFV